MDFDLVVNPDSGQHFVRMPGRRDYMPIKPEQADIIREGGIESFVKAAGNSIAQIATGAGAIAGSERSREMYDSLSENQNIRASTSPIAGGIGAFAPDAALAIGTGGVGTAARVGLTTAGRRIAATSVAEGAINAARSPDNPLQGFIVGATVGAAVPSAFAGVTRGLELAKAARTGSGVNIGGRLGEFIQPAVDTVRRMPRTVGAVDVDAARSGALRSLSAAARSADAAPYQASDTLMGLDFEGAASRGLRLTEGDAVEGMARNTDDASRGAQLREQEELSRSNPASVMGRTVNAIRDEQEQWLTNRAASEVGNPNLERFSIPNTNKERVRISNTFDRVLKRGDESATLKLNADDIEAIQQAVADVPLVAENATFRRIAEDIDTLIEEGGTISGKELNAVRSTLNQARDRLINKPTTYDAGVALDEIESVFTKRLRDSMSPEDLEDFDEALSQWKVIKAVEGSLRAADAGGKLKPKTFRNVYMRQNPLVRKGYVAGEFENDIMVSDFVLDSAGLANSRTADRLIPYLMGAGGLGAAGGLLGGN